MLRLYCALGLLLSPAVFAQPAATEQDRLIATARLWATVKYFHPYLAYRDIDWDKALVDALPGIQSASSAAEYAKAVTGMLDALRDRASYAALHARRENQAAIHYRKQADGTLAVSEGSEPPSASNDELAQAIRSARNIVFDLHVPPGMADALGWSLDQPAISDLLISSRAVFPGQRTWIHTGLSSPAFQVRPGLLRTGNGTVQEHRIVFRLGEGSRLPIVAVALAHASRDVLISEAPHYDIAGIDTVTIPMGDGVDAVVRLSEPVFPDGTSPWPTPRPDRAYAESRYPSAEYRILAAYKVWAVFRDFFAYRDLMDEDWDDVFASFLPKFIAAKDAREYNLTIAEMITHVSDSNATVESDELSEYFGEAPPGLRVRLIEKKPVITGILDDEANKAGLRAGDIVTSVDGEGIIQRINRVAQHISSSTQQSLADRVMERILNGREGSSATLTTRGDAEQSKRVALKRISAHKTALGPQRNGEAVKILPGNIGYVDLDRLASGEVEGMFDKLRDMKAIIFDARGSTHGLGPAIASHLTTKTDVAAAIVTGPLTLTPDLVHSGQLTSTASFFLVEALPPPANATYKGKTVMLIDERTTGEAEHTGLYLEAANNTAFVGSASAGCDGQTNSFVVPGGVTITFSSNDVRHGNGGKLQRLGLQPAENVSPTVAGIRAGRDEVLERAVEYVSR